MRHGTKWLIAVLAALAAVAVLVPSIAMGALGMAGMGGGMMGNGMIGRGMMSGCALPGSGMAGSCPAIGTSLMADSGWTQGVIVGLHALATLALWGAVAVAVILAVRWLLARPAADTAPLSILQRRYAAGEIDAATYAEMRAALDA
jgi:hypothetical protein